MWIKAHVERRGVHDLHEPVATRRAPPDRERIRQRRELCIREVRWLVAKRISAAGGLDEHNGFRHERINAVLRRSHLNQRTIRCHPISPTLPPPLSVPPTPKPPTFCAAVCAMASVLAVTMSAFVIASSAAWNAARVTASSAACSVLSIGPR